MLGTTDCALLRRKRLPGRRDVNLNPPPDDWVSIGSVTALPGELDSSNDTEADPLVLLDFVEMDRLTVVVSVNTSELGALNGLRGSSAPACGVDVDEECRCVRTTSRICSIASLRLWKYAKKYESIVICSSRSTTLISRVSEKSIAVDRSTSRMTE